MTHQTKSSKQYDTVQFQSNYTDFVSTFLESHFPDRYADFKNIECLIQELHNLYKEISKTDKIAPFNPNLPVLNISECNQVVGINHSPKDFLKKKSSTTTKRIRKKKGLLTHKAFKTLETQNEVHGREKESRRQMKKRPNDDPSPEPINRSKKSLVDEFDDEMGKQIARNLEDILSDDTFTPRYKSTHASDMFMIFQKVNRNELPTSKSDCQLKREDIEQNEDDSVETKFSLLEIQARQQYES